MTSEQGRQRDIERLQELLDVYGGDRDRWPLHERRSVAELLAQDRQAQQLVRDARVFDLMIESCQLQSPSRQKQSKELAHLSDRILAQVQAEKEPIGPAHQQRYRAVPISRPVRTRMWQAVSLLAACLVIGIMVGRSGVLLADGAQVAEAGSVEDSLAGLLPDEGLIFFAEEDMI